MQNKNILVVFTVLLALATLYTLSFNWVASGYETTADEYGAFVADSLEQADALEGQTFEEAAAQAAREFLRDSAAAEIYPVFGHTYRQVKEQELNLGLDLKGGMSVTLEVSLPISSSPFQITATMPTSAARCLKPRPCVRRTAPTL